MPIDDMIINFNQLRKARLIFGPKLMSDIINIFARWSPADNKYMRIDLSNYVSLTNDIDSDGCRYFSYKKLASLIGADASYWRR